MVAITFRLSELGRVELTLSGPERWESILRRCSEETGLEPGSVIAVRAGMVLKSSDLIVDGDAVDVFPAISGG